MDDVLRKLHNDSVSELLRVQFEDIRAVHCKSREEAECGGLL